MAMVRLIVEAICFSRCFVNLAGENTLSASPLKPNTHAAYAGEEIDKCERFFLYHDV
jgi:hypothetical protein